MRPLINHSVYAVAFCLAGTSGARAQPVAMPPVFNWSGVYAGVNGGFGGDDAKPRYVLASPSATNGFPGSGKTDDQAHRLGGGFAGGQVGYNYQFRNDVVLGVESDLQWSNVRASNRSDSGVVFDATSPFPIVVQRAAETAIKQNWFGTTRLRLGYQFADRFLGYVTGGVAYSGFTASNWGTGAELSPFPVVFSHTSGTATSTKVGWTVGAGFEYALSNHLSVKSEYLYSEYSGFTAPFLNTELSTPAVTSGTFSTCAIGLHQVRAGLNYRLGDPAVASAAGDEPIVAPSRHGSDWTGFYAGVNGGYGAGIAKPALSDVTQRQIMFFPAGETDTSSINQTMRASGFLIGAQFGYNRQLANRLIGGFETDMQWSGIRASSASTVSGFYNPPSSIVFSSNSRVIVGQNWFGTTRLRLGYQAFDRFLAYATGGVAYAGFIAGNSGTADDGTGGLTVTTGSSGSTKIGWTAGAGGEYAIAPNLTFKTEYLYSEYGGFDVPYQSTFTGPVSTAATRGTLYTGTLGIHLVRAGLNWRFGESGR